MADKVRKIDSEYLKEKRRKRRAKQRRVQLIIFGTLIALIILIVLYMFTPISNIDHVEVKGNHYLSDKEAKQALDLKRDTKIYMFGKGKAINKMKEIRFVKDVQIKRKLPNNLEVNVSEYQLVGLLEDKGKYHPVLSNDHILKDYKGQVPNDAPVISGFNESRRDKMIQALSEIPTEIRQSISEVEYADDKDNRNKIRLYMKDGIQVIGNIRTIADKLKYYPEMVSALERDDSGELKKSGYIDLYVGASFIPYKSSSSTSSDSSVKLKEGTAMEDKAKDELQNTLNKINDQMKDDKTTKDNSQKESSTNN